MDFVSKNCPGMHWDWTAAVPVFRTCLANHSRRIGGADVLEEMFARMKALEPGLFEDRYYNDILRDLPKDWRYLLERIAWA